MKEVLLITFYFYPSNHIAAQRPARFAKYLPRFGWSPSIACVEWTPENSGPYYDPTLVSALPQHNVVCRVPVVSRPHSTQPVRFYWRRLWQEPKLCLWKLLSRKDALFHPERLPVEFYRSAISQLAHIMERGRFGVIWATNPPAVTHAVADHLARRFQVPWVADFRDVWDTKSLTSNECLRRRLLRNEPRLLKSSSAIVTVCAPAAEVLRERHQRDVAVISNGFDPDDYAIADRQKRGASNGEFTMVYTGTVRLDYMDPTLLFTAVRRLARRGHIYSKGFAVKFYGEHHGLRELIIRDFPDLLHLVSLNMRITRQECLSIQKNATVLLHLPHPAERGIVTGKLFEYLGAQRPILALPCDDGVVRELLRETQAGTTCRTVEEVVAILEQWLQEWNETGVVRYRGDIDAVRRYSAEVHAQQLAEILDRVSLTDVVLPKNPTSG